MCVVCWLIPLFLTRNSPGPTPHSHKHTPRTHTHTRIRTQTYQKACLPLFSKSHDFIFSAICDRNQPSTNHSCSGRSLKLLFSINSVQIIYFIYTLNSFFSHPNFSVWRQLKICKHLTGIFIDLLSFCAHFCLLEIHCGHRRL